MVKKVSYVIVIKLGTSSIVHEKTHQPLLSLLSSLVETVVHLRSEGHKVVLVSSGAIGVGLKRMEIPSRPKGLAAKQVRLEDVLAIDHSLIGEEFCRLSLLSDRVA
jgi:glutamate 5-kinase